MILIPDDTSSEFDETLRNFFWDFDETRGQQKLVTSGIKMSRILHDPSKGSF